MDDERMKQAFREEAEVRGLDLRRNRNVPGYYYRDTEIASEWWQSAWRAATAAENEANQHAVCWLCGSDNAAKYPLDPSGCYHESPELANGFVACDAAKIRARLAQTEPSK